MPVVASAPPAAADDRVADREAEHAEQRDDEEREQERVAAVRRDLGVEGVGHRGRSARSGGRAVGPAGSRDQLQAEVDVRDVGARLGLGVEELALREAEQARDEHVRERLDRGVVVEDARVVVLAAERDLVLGRGQLLLELEDVLVRLELGIVLDDGEQRAERAGQGVLGGGLLGRALGAGGDRVGAGRS